MIQVPAFALPESSLLDDETRMAMRIASEVQQKAVAAGTLWPVMEETNPALAPALRQGQAAAFYESSFYKQVRDRYAVKLSSQTIGGVYTERFTPAEGIAPKNQQRVLLNLHGGAFRSGARTNSHLESIPIVAVGQIEVISIDYRQAPEHVFPAASEDASAVYRELLKTYKPKNIGLYGCSAGGLLTAQIMAWLQRERLPLPGAVGLFCAGASYWCEGDSGCWGSAIMGAAATRASENPYLKDAQAAGSLAFPAQSVQVLAQFPPTLLVSATRDYALSSVVHTHSLLTAQGVYADLHVWEGLGHAFFFDPALPQSREMYALTVKFFDRHLGQ